MSFWKKLARTLSKAATSAGQITASVTSSPVWKIAAVGVNVIPGLGTAVSAGMLAATKVGGALASKDALVGALRSELPSDALKAGFDAASGIAKQGGGMSGPDLLAVRMQLPSAARPGFDAGLSLHAGRVTSKKPAPAALKTPQARAAYYATKGLINTKAPKAFKKNVVKTAVRTPAARAGATLAVKTSPGYSPKDESWLTWAIKHVRHALGGHPA